MVETAGATVPDTMAQAVLKLVRERPGTSWVELCQYIEGARGDRCVRGGHNVVLWNGVSDDLIAAVNELMATGAVEVRQCPILIYAVDAGMLAMPLATKVPAAGYSQPHWLPTVLNLPRAKRR